MEKDQQHALKKACFLDRDGVIIEDRHYISKPDDVHLLPGVVHALHALEQFGYILVIVSNQSGIARGYFTEKELKEVNEKMIALLKLHGLTLSGIYYCPHHEKGSVQPYARACTCRKPEPGLLIKAAQELHIDLTQSIMIGDKESDVQTGQAASCAQNILLSKQAAPLGAFYHVARTLEEAVNTLINH